MITTGAAEKQRSSTPNAKEVQTMPSPDPELRGSGASRLFDPRVIVVLCSFAVFYICALYLRIGQAEQALLSEYTRSTPPSALVAMPRWNLQVTRQSGHASFPADGRVHVSFERFWISQAAEDRAQRWEWHQQAIAFTWKGLQECWSKYDPENVARRAREWMRKSRQAQDAEYDHCLCLKAREGPRYDAQAGGYLTMRTTDYCKPRGGGHHEEPFAKWRREFVEREHKKGNPFGYSLTQPFRVPRHLLVQ